MCAKRNVALCETCRLAGLVRCPELGVALPLVDGERPRVIRNKAFSVRVFPGDGDGISLRSTRGPQLTESEVLRIWRWMSERRRG